MIVDGAGRRAEGEAAPAPLTPRQSRMYRLFDPTQGRGLEIGPLNAPVVPRATGDVRYVDVHDRGGLQDSYRSHEGFPLDDIEAPDFVLLGPDGMRTLPEAAGAAAPFDWVVASHVVEHVPDVIGWLSEVAAVLEDEGALLLAVPDRRLCFDAERHPTTVGDMLLAHRSRDVRPSARAVYDHFSRCVHINPLHIWHGGGPGERMYDTDFVLGKLASAEAGEYVDCHVWVWTPASFVEQLAELAALDLLDFRVDEVVDPDVDDIEFFVRLRRLPRGLDRAERDGRRAQGVQSWTDVELPLQPAPEPVEEPAPDPDAVQASLSHAELRVVLAKRRVLEAVRRALRR